MQVKRVLLVRHGETDHNRERRVQGVLDTPLNATGREQAYRVAEYLAQQPIGAIYSSTLMRAHDTARAIADKLGLRITQDERLCEMNFGIFQGLLYDERELHHPEVYRQYQSDDPTYVIPGGESRDQFQARARAAFDDIIATAQAETLVMVAHGGTIKAMLRSLMADAAQQIDDIPNTSVTTLQRTDDGWHIVAVGQLPHDKITP